MTTDSAKVPEIEAKFNAEGHRLTIHGEPIGPMAGSYLKALYIRDWLQNGGWKAIREYEPDK